MGDYLRLRKGIYHFRRKVPVNLIQILGVQEITRSTGTGDRRLAKKKAREMLLASDRLFEIDCAGEIMENEQLKQLARKYYSEKFEKFEESMANTSNRESYPTVIDELLRLYKQALKSNSVEPVVKSRNEFLASQQIGTLSDPRKAALFDQFLLRAEIACLEKLRENDAGNFGYVPIDELFKDDLTERKSNAPTKIISLKPLFSVASTSHLEKRLEEGAIDIKTASNYRMTYRNFVEVVGDKPFDEYTRVDISAYMDTATLLPANWSKGKEYKGLTFKEIIRKTKGLDIQRLSQSALGKHLRALSGFYKIQFQKGEMENEGPTKHYKISKGAPAPKQRLIWSADMLVKLFSAPLWTGAKSKNRLLEKGEVLVGNHKYWLPILALFHGNRTEEFAQLRIEDLKEEEGIHYFYLTNEDGRKLKNDNSKRCVPIHPFVKELGFLDYYKSVFRNPQGRIFPEMKRDAFEKKFGPNFSKWFTRYRQKFGVYVKFQDAHSFRHNATNKLFEMDVAEHLIDELTGHKGGSISRQVYKGKMPIQKLYEAISKIEWLETEELLLKYKRKF